MSKIMTGATMSLDGYISGPNETGFDLLFRWYADGEVETPTANPQMTLRTSAASAEHLRRLRHNTGALVVGRHLYDMTNGWGGRHPMDVPVVVVTHRPPVDRPMADENFVFVTDGIEAAIDKAREIAAGKWVGVNGGTIVRQCLDAGLLDEVHVDLVPVILGAGTPFFSELTNVPVELEGPVSVVEGTGVTHLAYRVARKRP